MLSIVQQRMIFNFFRVPPFHEMFYAYKRIHLNCFSITQFAQVDTSRALEGKEMQVLGGGGGGKKT